MNMLEVLEECQRREWLDVFIREMGLYRLCLGRKKCCGIYGRKEEEACEDSERLRLLRPGHPPNWELHEAERCSVGCVCTNELDDPFHNR